MESSLLHEEGAGLRGNSLKKGRSFFCLFGIITLILAKQSMKRCNFPSKIATNTVAFQGKESNDFHEMILRKLSEVENELKDMKTKSYDLNRKVIQFEQTLSQHESTVDDLVESKLASYNLDQRLPINSALSTEAMDEEEDGKISQKVFSDIPSPMDRHEEAKTAFQDEFSSRNYLINRSLQQVDIDLDQATEEFAANSTDYSHKFIQDVCNSGTILSPINFENNFQWDEKLDRILTIVKSISSADSLLNVDTPQYKATCWLMFQEVDNIKADATLVQTYIMIVFYFSAVTVTRQDSDPDLKMLLPDRVCSLSSFQCKNGKLIGIDFGKYVHISIPKYTQVRQQMLIQ